MRIQLLCKEGRKYFTKRTCLLLIKTLIKIQLIKTINIDGGNIMKRIICLILCILMISSGLIACKKEEQPEVTESIVETTEMDMSNVCEVPDTDEWKGREFRAWSNEYSKTDMFSEGINGEVLNDAVFQRNMMVEEKYGITIDTGELSKEDTKNLLIFLNVLHGHTISKVDQRRLYVWLESRGFPYHD